MHRRSTASSTTVSFLSDWRRTCAIGGMRRCGRRGEEEAEQGSVHWSINVVILTARVFWVFKWTFDGLKVKVLVQNRKRQRDGSMSLIYGPSCPPDGETLDCGSWSDSLRSDHKPPVRSYLCQPGGGYRPPAEVSIERLAIWPPRPHTVRSGWKTDGWMASLQQLTLIFWHYCGNPSIISSSLAKNKVNEKTENH